MQEFPTEISLIQNVLKYDSKFNDKSINMLQSKKGFFAEQLEVISLMKLKFGDCNLVILACMDDYSQLKYLIKEFPKTKFLVIVSKPNQFRKGSPIYNYVLLKFDAKIIGPKLDTEIFNNPDAKFKKFDQQEVDLKYCDGFDDLDKLHKFMKSAAPCAIVASHYSIELAKNISKILSKRQFKICLISELKERILGGTSPDCEVLFSEQKNHVFAKIIKADIMCLKTRFPYAVASQSANFNRILKLPRVIEVRREFRRLFRGPDNWDLYKTHMKCSDEKDGCPYRTFDGVFSIRPWGSKGTSETRLISTSLQLKRYDCHDYENRLFTVRMLRYFEKYEFFGNAESYDKTLEKFIILKFAARKAGFDAATNCEFLKFYKENRDYVENFISKYRK